MEEVNSDLDLGMLCTCCDYQSYRLPVVEGFSKRQLQLIEDLCKLCLENNQVAVDR